MDAQHQSFYTIFRHEGLSFGRKHAKKDFRFFLQIFVLLGLVSFIPKFINILKGWPLDTRNLGTWIAGIIGLIFAFGMVKIYLHFVHEKKIDIKDLVDHEPTRFCRRILSRLIAGIVTGVGLVLLIAPGIYVAARLYLYEYFVVDQDMNSIDAISASLEVTNGHVREIIGIWLLSLGIFILGAIPLGVGLLRAIPTVKLAQATLYKKLTSHAHHIE